MEPRNAKMSLSLCCGHWGILRGGRGGGRGAFWDFCGLGMVKAEDHDLVRSLCNFTKRSCERISLGVSLMTSVLSGFQIASSPQACLHLYLLCANGKDCAGGIWHDWSEQFCSRTGFQGFQICTLGAVPIDLKTLLRTHNTLDSFIKGRYCGHFGGII